MDKFIKMVNFRSRKIFKCIIACTVYGSLIIVAYILYKTYGDTTMVDIKDKYTIYITGIMSIGILIAYRQIVSSNDLSRRQLSMTESIRILENIREKRKELEQFKEMDYSQELQKKHAISYQDIHNWICKKKDNTNNQFIGEKGQYELTDKGKEIRTLIRATINDYEYLAVGIVNGAFDEQIIKDGMKSMTIDTCYSFSNYINHVQSSESNNFAMYFKWLADRWSNNNHDKTILRDK
jgi:hypothetical protein